MTEPICDVPDFGITCIDADYVQPGTACFYLMQQGDDFAVLETGTSHSVAALQRVLQARRITPEQIRFIIPTHVHLDHAGGAGAMMSLFPRAQLLIHPRGARHMVDPERLVAAATAVYGESLFVSLYGEVVPVDIARIRQIADGETLFLGDRPLHFRHTRGHAEHHFCIWDELSCGWFSGDMFGVSYPWCRFTDDDFLLPSTTPSQFDPGAYLASLDLLASYAPKQMYLTHSNVLRYSESKAQRLRSQIALYCELAADDDGAADTLQQKLSDYTVRLFTEFAAGLCGESETGIDETTLRNKLSFDMQLNAQGLQIWQQRKDH